MRADLRPCGRLVPRHVALGLPRRRDLDEPVPCPNPITPDEKRCPCCEEDLERARLERKRRARGT